MTYKKTIPFIATIFLLSACDSRYAKQEFWIGENGELTIESANPSKTALEPTKTLVIDANIPQISDVRTGMSWHDIRALNHPISIRTIRIEGDPYPVIDTMLTPNHKISSTMNFDGKAYLLDTISPYIQDKNGLGVGSNLEQLKTAYPTGKFMYGREHGLYANFITGTYLIFEFDPKEMESSCFDIPKDCNNLENLKVKSLIINDIEV